MTQDVASERVIALEVLEADIVRLRARLEQWLRETGRPDTKTEVRMAAYITSLLGDFAPALTASLATRPVNDAHQAFQIIVEEGQPCAIVGCSLAGAHVHEGVVLTIPGPDGVVSAGASDG
jgi:hypothetical protein